jgi:hypothetical protein
MPIVIYLTFIHLYSHDKYKVNVIIYLYPKLDKILFQAYVPLHCTMFGKVLKPIYLDPTHIYFENSPPH